MPFRLRPVVQIGAHLAQMQPPRREARAQHHSPGQRRPSRQRAVEGAERGALREVHFGVVGHERQRNGRLIQHVPVLLRGQECADQVAADVRILRPVAQCPQQERRGFPRLPCPQAQEAIEVAGTPVGDGGLSRMCVHPAIMRLERLTKGLRGRRFLEISRFASIVPPWVLSADEFLAYRDQLRGDLTAQCRGEGAEGIQGPRRRHARQAGYLHRPLRCGDGSGAGEDGFVTFGPRPIDSGGSRVRKVPHEEHEESKPRRAAKA